MITAAMKAKAKDLPFDRWHQIDTMTFYWHSDVISAWVAANAINYAGVAEWRIMVEMFSNNLLVKCPPYIAKDFHSAMALANRELERFKKIRIPVL